VLINELNFPKPQGDYGSDSCETAITLLKEIDNNDAKTENTPNIIPQNGAKKPV
jgi:hypothetical protein